MNKIFFSLNRPSASCVSIIIILLGIIASSWLFSFQIAHNVTESLPQKFFFILEGRMPEKYQYVAFSKENKFYNKGFIKQVVGKGGDQIEIDDSNNIWISSAFITDRFNAGFIKQFSLLGERLNPLNFQKIPEGYYYVFAPHKDSLDSRYSEIGLIKSTNIIGRAIPIEFFHLILPLIIIVGFFVLLKGILVRSSKSVNIIGFIFCLAFLMVGSKDLFAEDLGIHGKVYPIKEIDLAQSIQDKLLKIEESGELLKIEQEQQKKVRERAERPKEVAGLSKAIIGREFTYDPSITANKDIYDHQGNVVVAKGTRVNPLSYRALPQRLLFIDGDSKDQVNWAFSKAEKNPSMIILVRGNIMQMMRDYKARLYFDQNGYMVKTFGIRATPAEVRQEGDVLVIKEEVL